MCGEINYATEATRDLPFKIYRLRWDKGRILWIINSSSLFSYVSSFKFKEFMEMARIFQLFEFGGHEFFRHGEKSSVNEFSKLWGAICPFDKKYFWAVLIKISWQTNARKLKIVAFEMWKGNFIKHFVSFLFKFPFASRHAKMSQHKNNIEKNFL